MCGMGPVLEGDSPQELSADLGSSHTARAGSPNLLLRYLTRFFLTPVTPGDCNYYIASMIYICA